MKKLNLLIIVSCFLLTQASLAMGGAPPANVHSELHINVNHHPEPRLEHDKDIPIPLLIDEILTMPEIDGQMVIVEGRFRPWRHLGYPRPVTVDDWVLVDPSGAIYVHGPYPHGVHRNRPQSLGQRVRIEGRVRIRHIPGRWHHHRVVYIDTNKPDPWDHYWW